MKVRLEYGRCGLIVNFPDAVEVLAPNFIPGLPDEKRAIQEALRHPIGSRPLATLVKPGDKVVITHTDITRATPNDRLIPVLLDELETAGIERQHITLLNSVGTHRKQTETELCKMLGEEIVNHYRCIQHDPQDDTCLVSFGQTSFGHPVRINRWFVEADIRILTGFIEPHFFAGFSGGPKGVLPGLADLESVQTNHGYTMLSHPLATWGVTAGNPVWEEMREVALLTTPTFLLNVTLNSKRQITGVFAGDMLKAHSKGCAFVKENAMLPVKELFDIVITTNSGYPLDQNLYQSTKGISSANQIIREGGTIIIATACEDGLPENGNYSRLLLEAGSLQRVIDMISRPEFSEPDQWAVQIQTRVQQKADVYVYSDGLTAQQIRRALYTPCRDIESLVAEVQSKYGSNSRICVLPEGPQGIPYMDSMAL